MTIAMTCNDRSEAARERRALGLGAHLPLAALLLGLLAALNTTATLLTLIRL